MSMYIKRSIEPVLKQAAAEFPAVILTGPRQSGKTTTLKHLFINQYRYISLESPDVRISALNDPRAFLEMYPPPVIYDEIQYAPALLHTLRKLSTRIEIKQGNFFSLDHRTFY